MKRTYAQGWTEIFGTNPPDQSPGEQEADSPTRPNTHAQPAEPKSLVDSAVVHSAEINWPETRALSIRQPWAELIMRGDKETEYRSGRTRIRGRISIYASLSKNDLPEAPNWGLDPDDLPRGVIIGTVELYGCDGGDWYLRAPRRLATPIKPTKHPQPIWFYPFGRE